MIRLLLLLLLINNGSSHDECKELSCGPNEPLISFPFQLVKGSQDQCAYPEFCLYCTQYNKTMIVLSTTSGLVNFFVSNIIYEIRLLSISDPENCLPNKFLKLNNSSFLPYQFYSLSETKYSFFNCSSSRKQHLRNIEQTYLNSQDMITCPIYASNSQDSVLTLDLVSCTKMFDVQMSTAAEYLSYNQLRLSWPRLNCTECEAKGMTCKWKNNSTKGETECFDCNNKRKTIQIPNSLIYASTVKVFLGSIFLALVLIALFKIHLYFRKKEEDQIRVDKFLEDYKAQKPTRFSYADLKRITGGFKEKLGEGAHGTVFKGKLSSEILVAVKMLNNTSGEGKEFINEVGIMGKIHHINVVRLLGFCADGIHRALVYNFFPNGSLQSFIFPPDNKDHFMGWEKLQQIGIGIAKGIEYLHQGCNHPIIHFDINPHNVLLDCSFTPKISDFGLAKLCCKNRSAVSMTAAKGTLGYMAPEVLSRNFGNVSLKSDIYRYGILLLEMVGGRKNVDISSAEAFHVLYPEWIHNLLEGDVHIHIEDESDVKIAKKLAIVGLWCIQWQPINRPSIKTVVQMLKTGEDIQLMVPPNPFRSMTSMTNNDQCTLARTTFQMEVIHE
ncbi:rust resistance kinase Lr10-like [Trifolium pratense]|uniref:rust resistance kinase Lr10-like n=1 Tax=Trifolium pratense TaxID=57577 RepID=UPI001E6982E4|nr:rust resistance kinase Lr10-like [Trifolium pratense]